MKKTFLKDSAAVASLSLLTAFAGLLVDVLLASRYGLGSDTDAFYAAYTVPFLFSYICFAIGQTTLVPVLSRLMARESRDELWRYFSTVLNIALAVSAAFTLLGVLAAPWVVAASAPGLDASTSATAVRLCRALFLLAGFSALAEIFRSFLYAGGSFIAASGASLLRNAATAGFIFAFSGRMGIEAAAWGFIAGHAAQFLALLVGILPSRPRYMPVLDTSAWGLKETRDIGSVQVAGFLILQAVTVGERFIGSFLPPGSITALSYASRIVFMAVETFAGSIAISTLPKLSRAVAEGRGGGELLGRSFRIVFAVFLPMTAFIAAAGGDIISVLYRRGSFTAEAASLTAWVFILYSLSMTVQGFNRLTHNFLYAEMKPRRSLALFVTLAAVALAADFALVGTLGISALPLGYLAGACAAFLLGYRRFLSGLQVLTGRGLPVFALKVLALSALSGLAAYAAKGLAGGGEGLSALAGLAASLAAAAAVAGICWHLMGIGRGLGFGAPSPAGEEGI